MKFLLNVGAEKAGTTWLYEYFKNHPKFYDNGKELNVIQRNDIVPTHTQHPDYKENIENYFSSIAALKQVTGDFTHYEGSTENVFRLIKDGLSKHGIEIVPVYIMRDPINRAWSAWHELARGAIYHRIQHQSLYNFDMPAPAAFVIHNMLQCKYKETIEALDKVFDEPLYFFYEDFFKQDNIDKICDRLEIGYVQADLDKKVIPTVYVEPDPRIEFINMFCYTKKNLEAIEFLKERFGHVPWDLSRYERN
jgi:hypothetical protein